MAEHVPYYDRAPRLHCGLPSDLRAYKRRPLSIPVPPRRMKSYATERRVWMRLANCEWAIQYVYGQDPYGQADRIFCRPWALRVRAKCRIMPL